MARTATSGRKLTSTNSTFGVSTIGGTTTTVALNRYLMGKFNIAADVTVQSITYYGNSASGTIGVDVIIFSDVAGTPVVRKGVKQSTVGTTLAWNTVTFDTPLNLPAGNYWLGLIFSGTFNFYYEATGGTSINTFVNSSYTNQGANPYDGSGGGGTLSLSIYANYTSTSRFLLPTDTQYSLNLDGSGDFVTVTNNAVDLSVFTYAAWVKVRVMKDNTIRGDTKSSGTRAPKFRTRTDGTIDLLEQGVAGIGASTGKITVNKWTHVAVTYSATGAYVFYINGVSAGSGTTLRSFQFGDLLVGSSPDAGEDFNGFIKNFMVFSSALSATEISNIYYKGFTTTAPTLKLLFNEGSGTTANDSSGNGYNGTITNATYSSDVPFQKRTAVSSRSGGSGGAFDPDSVAGLKLWLKADSLSLSDDDPVSTWTDSSGSGNDAVGSLTARPLYKTSIVNSLPVVRFDGSNDLMDTPSISWTNQSIFIVLQSADTNAYAVAFTTGSENALIFGFDANTLEIYNTPRVDVGNFTSFAYGTVIRDSAGSTTTRRNGVETATDASVAIPAAGVVRLGNHFAGSGPFAGDIAEILIYDAVIAGDDLTNIEAYLAGKYGI